MSLIHIAAALLAVALGAVSLSAQDTHQGHDADTMTTGSNPENPATNALRDANAKMHRDMDIPLSGNPDVDFAKGMIPHHQGAIDMAKVVLAYGKDPELRKLAEEIIEAQEGEIAILEAWLKKQGQ